jgi:hypothetical protein
MGNDVVPVATHLTSLSAQTTRRRDVLQEPAGAE